MSERPTAENDAWDCDHHPEWADNRNVCHHPAHAAENDAAEVAVLAELLDTFYGSVDYLPTFEQAARAILAAGYTRVIPPGKQT